MKGFFIVEGDRGEREMERGAQGRYTHTHTHRERERDREKLRK